MPVGWKRSRRPVLDPCNALPNELVALTELRRGVARTIKLLPMRATGLRLLVA